MVTHEELSFSTGPIGEAIVGDPTGVGLRTELHDCLVDLGELNQSKTILLKRLVVLIELGHIQCELVVICLNWNRLCYSSKEQGKG